jgi:hypothetical protein
MGITEDIVNLSSGTISALTGYKDFEKIDEFQNEFTEYAEEYTNHNWKSWLDAYRDFQAYRVEKDRYDSIRYDDQFDTEMRRIYREG